MANVKLKSVRWRTKHPGLVFVYRWDSGAEAKRVEPPSGCVSVGEAARVLDRPEVTVQRMLRLKQLPYFLIRGLRRIRVSELAAFVRAGR